MLKFGGGGGGGGGGRLCLQNKTNLRKIMGLLSFLENFSGSPFNESIAVVPQKIKSD